MKKTILFLIPLAILIGILIYVIAEGNEQVVYPVCCVNEDGYCRDILVKAGEGGCGKHHQTYTFLSSEKFCIALEDCCMGDCQEGDCFIRGKLQPDKKQYYVCAALCKETGECRCDGGLDNCVGDWDWEFNP